MARHQARTAALRARLQGLAGHPGQQISVAADYLRGAVARTSRDVPAEAAATGREAAAVLTELGDRLFQAAIKKRRSTR
ncbi:hypothetical protein ABN034_12520 [Actinopolymorpha sp. B11F2]|uniref:hypothetical protein n=1 Tax=Actinopolymorpha sp. B11F2 TaxID=3160862 RepID=UPI0032E4D6A9